VLHVGAQPLVVEFAVVGRLCRLPHIRDQAAHLAQAKHIDRDHEGVEREKRQIALEVEIGGEERIGEDRREPQRNHRIGDEDEDVRRRRAIADRLDEPVLGDHGQPGFAVRTPS